jgi:hypothetical protein
MAYLPPPCPPLLPSAHMLLRARVLLACVRLLLGVRASSPH